jgi:hypothetical protein
VELGPCLGESSLRTGNLASDQVDWIHAEDSHVVLIERVKVWRMVLRTGLREHSDHDAEEPADFWHEEGFEQLPRLGTCDGNSLVRSGSIRDTQSR